MTRAAAASGVFGMEGPIGAPGGGVIGGTDVSRWVASPRYYALADLISSLAAGGLVVNQLYASPFTMTQQRTLDRLGFYVHTGAAGPPPGVARAGIFDTHEDGGPRNLLVDGGEVSTVFVGAKESVINLTLPAGRYWRVLLLGITAAQVQCAGNTPEPIARIGFGAIQQAVAPLLWTPFAYGPLPAAWPGVGNLIQSSAPILFARFSA